jgi:hypothetical protein
VKQSEAKIETDRNEVLAEVEKLKQKFDMEKVLPIFSPYSLFIRDVDSRKE